MMFSTMSTMGSNGSHDDTHHSIMVYNPVADDTVLHDYAAAKLGITADLARYPYRWNPNRHNNDTAEVWFIFE